MLSNISYLRRRTVLLGRSFWKNPSEGIFRLWQVFISSAQSIYRIAGYRTTKYSLRYKRLLGLMIVFISIHILDQMIRSIFSTLFGSWYPHVVVGIFFWIISLWLLADSAERTSAEHST